MASSWRTGPQTPTKAAHQGAKDPGRSHVEELNRKYNLGVFISDEPQSPAAKAAKARVDAHFRRHNAIINLLRYHHYRGAGNTQLLLSYFDTAVRAYSADRARTRAAYVAVSAAVNAPRASSSADQVALQELLLGILEKGKIAALESRPGSQRFAGHGNRHDGNGQVEATPVRAAAAAAAAATVAASIDRVPVISTVAASADHAPATPPRGPAQQGPRSVWPDIPPYGASASTDDSQGTSQRPTSRDSSHSSASSAMFSAVDQLEEDTSDQLYRIDTSPAQRMLQHSAPSEASSDSFSISSDEENALEESFNMYYQDSVTEDDSFSNAQRAVSPADTSGLASILDIGQLQISGDTDTRDGSDGGVPGLQDRLVAVFPPTPRWLGAIPFPIAWEFLRIALFCEVDPASTVMQYSAEWQDQDKFRKAISRSPHFAGKALPERSNQFAWDAALHRRPLQGSSGRIPVFVIQMDFNKTQSGPLYLIKPQPITLDLSHRLARKFGPDRYLEILFPSHHSRATLVPRVLRNHDAAVAEVNRWLTRSRHEFAGRQWASFYVKNVGYKKPTTADEPLPGETADTVLQKRVFLFAEDGQGIGAVRNTALPSAMPMRVTEMLDWLLQYEKFPQNRKQPYLKLFSRIALGLSRTRPTIVFEVRQLRHQGKDIMSCNEKFVMNDGVARMSLSVARKLREFLELGDLPCAVQGRLGAAKGMWILDTEDTGQEDWIETFPSQRKWQCDYADEEQRTLEVRSFASEARPAGLNMQFLPVLEDRAIDKGRLRRVIGEILRSTMQRDLESYRKAMEHPLLFSNWVYEHSTVQSDHILNGQMPFLGGLPDRDEDTIQFLLSGGFDPRRLHYLWAMVFAMQEKKCQRVKDKMNVRIGRTAYLHMVVDFLGVLEEGEVQVCFSSKFRADADGEADENGDDGSFSNTLLVGSDVLLARAPAHFASDMQKVRVVFRPELCALKDVVVFSRKGPRPLADKLSGGDYDGDLAWVCWDPRLVNNFENAPDPRRYDLRAMGYMLKVTDTLDDLWVGGPAKNGTPASSASSAASPSPGAAAMADLLERSFAFDMQEQLLGRLTLYKEKLCYHRGSISDETAEILSTLLGDLVDQSKQGYEFTYDDFRRLRKERLKDGRGRAAPEKLAEPAYRKKSWSGQGEEAVHIIDYLKYGVAVPTIKRELDVLHAARTSVEASMDNGYESDGGSRGGSGSVIGGPEKWDADLAQPAMQFEALGKKSDTCRVIFEALKADIKALEGAWTKAMQRYRQARGAKDVDHNAVYRQEVLDMYERWCQIQVRLPRRGGDDFEAADSTASTSVAARAAMAAMASTSTTTAATATAATAAAKKKKRLSGPAAVAVVAAAAADDEMEAMARLLQQDYLADKDHSQWAMIRASQAFRMFYYKESFAWKMGGRQLQAIKASMVQQLGRGQGGSQSSQSSNGSSGRSIGTGGVRVHVTPLMWAATKPDSKVAVQLVNRLHGMELAGVDYLEPEDLYQDDVL